jgi:hypothetical protein
MGSLRTHVVIPADFLAKIDAEVGPRKRSAYLVELAQAEFRRRKFLEFVDMIERDGPVMKDEDHPELAAMGTAAWVRQQRHGWDARAQRLREHEDSSE